MILFIDSPTHYQSLKDRETDELILEKLTSDYSLENLVLIEQALDQISTLLEEHQQIELLKKYNLPISNKLLLYGPSGCGKTIVSYVIAGELKKMIIVVNLGAIVS